MNGGGIQDESTIDEFVCLEQPFRLRRSYAAIHSFATTSGEHRISSVRTLYEELFSIGLEQRANTGADDLCPAFEEFPLSGSSNLERNGLNVGKVAMMEWGPGDRLV